MTTLSQLNGGGDIPLWTSGATYAQYQVVRSPADLQLYIRKTAAGSGVTDPSNDTTNYNPEGARPLKPIQSGNSTILTTTSFIDVTVSAVNLNKTELIYLGQSVGAGGGTAQENADASVRMFNTTTIRIGRGGAGTNTITVSWQLKEYF